MSSHEFRSEMPTTTSRPAAGTRKYVDCRETPSLKNCSLFISGTEAEVIQASREHMVSAHGHADGPELVEAIRRTMHDLPADERLA